MKIANHNYTIVLRLGLGLVFAWFGIDKTDWNERRF